MRSRAALAIAFGVMLASRSALAQATDPDTLFSEGAALMEEGNFADALPKLEEAQRLDPGIGTQFNIAACYEKLGKLGTAWRNYAEVERLARASGKKQRETAAHEKLEELRPRLSSLVLRSEEPGDVVVKLDGVIVNRSDWEMIPVDPGAHTLQASAAAKKPWTHAFEAPPSGERREIVVPKLEIVAGETKFVTVTKEKPNTKRTIGFIAGGIGVAGVAAAAVTGVLLLDAHATASERCKPKCVDQNGALDREGADAVQRGTTLLPINAVAWGVAIAGLGAGAFLILTSGSKTDATKAAAVLPWVGPNGGGLGAAARF